MHVPNGEHAGEEYRRLALDICTIFFFAIVFYFGLMFSVAHEMTVTTTEIEKFENASKQPNESEKKKSFKMAASQHAMGSIVDSPEHFERMQRNFADVMNRQTVIHKDDLDLKEISRLVSDDFTN